MFASMHDLKTGVMHAHTSVHTCSAFRGKVAKTGAEGKSFSQLDASGMLKDWSQKGARSGFVAKIRSTKEDVSIKSC